MPDAPLVRLGAWLRDRHDAELLAVARENGAVLDFPHPLNRGPVFAWLRPHILRASLPIVVLGNLAPLLAGRTPSLLVPLTAGLPQLGVRVALFAIEVGLVSLLTARVGRRWWERAVIAACQRHWWRAAAALDATIAAELERARTPKRLLPAPGERSHG